MARGLGEHHGVVGRHGVEVLRGDDATLGELALIPPAALNPRAFRRTGRLRPNRGGDIGDVLDLRVAQVEDVQALGTAIGEVRVSVEQPRCNRAPGEVDASRVRRGRSLHLRRRPHDDDAVAGDADGLSNAIDGVDGQHATVDEDQVGPRLL